MPTLRPLDVVRDEGRINALRRYEILDAPAERAFDDIVRLAAQLCSAPVATIDLLDVDRQFFIAEIGLGVRELPLETSISVHALGEDDVLVVPDLAADPRFAGRHDPTYRYYAGVPLRTPDGYAIGALSVVDRVPRLLSTQQLDGLRALARQTMTQLELRRALVAQQNAAAALRQSEERFRAAFDHAVIGMVLIDGKGRVLRANPAFEQIVGRTSAELLGRDSYDFTHEDDRNANVAWIRSVETGEISHATFEKRYIRKDGRVVWARVHLSPVGDDSGQTPALVGLIEDITESRRTRVELAETRRRLDSALIAGEVATYEWEINSDRVWGDANFDRIFGVARDADGTAPLARFIAAIHPDDRQGVQQKIAYTVETGDDYEAEYRIISSATPRWVIARGRLDRDAAGRPSRFHGVVLDITTRKGLQQELERRTRIYESILSTTDDFAYLFDRDGNFLFANRRLLEVWGKSLAEVVGKNVYELGYPQWHADMHMREIGEVIAGKQAITGEVPYTAPTGIFGVYEYIFSPVLGADGEVEVVAGTTRDVTARKRAEEANRELADQLRMALDAARMGWWQYDLLSGRVYWDERVRAMYGVTEELQDYHEILTRIHPDDAPGIQAAVEAATDAQNPRPYSVEYRLQMPDGATRWIASKGQALFEGEGKARRAMTLVGTALDVTEAKRAQNALEESEARFRQLAESERVARAEAERASRMKDEFLATLSHELRTPLSAILGWSQILAGEGNRPEDIAEGVAVISRNARAQAQIIEDLLEMSRIVSGKVRLDIEQIAIADVIHAAIATIRPAAAAKGVTVEARLNPPAHAITGDANRLQQVFWNLLSNAVKFTPRDGRVEVRLENRGSHIEVRVSDTGEGIRSEFLPFVFDRFRQADASTTRSHGGLGIGLAIVKQLVELHGGAISVSSAGEGRGATFKVTLPIEARVGESAPDPEDATQRRRSPMSVADLSDRIAGVRVLVVDDEPDAREVIRRILEDCHASVITASSSEEALEILARHPVDVLLSDIGMPREDGYALMRKVAERYPLLPAAALTAYARPEDRQKTADAGYKMHVVKPAEPAQVIAAVALLRANS